ncbi:hypothetical protein Scep_009051 [Stephania cephalantha]|uniref:Uncharacterized protein n=1 Tax=Stephania cephalantha TaxID=152367 RepID=A0AAP0JTC6_9MAGN
MADSALAFAPRSVLPLSTVTTKKESVFPISSEIEEMIELRSELLTRIQGLKQDLQNWRSKVDAQVKIYCDELIVLKKSLKVGQLRLEFQDLKTTLQQQQMDVTASLRKLGLCDAPEDSKEACNPMVDGSAGSVQALASEGNVLARGAMLLRVIS